MNAGDYKLYVGGGAINRAFGVLLREEQGLELVEVRWCLVSGGVSSHSGASKVEVASATLRGMRSVVGRMPVVTFTYDDDVFRQAHVQGK